MDELLFLWIHYSSISLQIYKKKWAFNYFQVKCSIFVRSIIALRQRSRHSLFQTPSEPNASLFLA